MSRFTGLSDNSARFRKGRINIRGENNPYKITDIQYDTLFNVVTYRIVNVRNSCKMYRIAEPTLEQLLNTDLVQYQ